MFASVVLISGGYGNHGDGEQSVEIYHPDEQSSCKIRDLPESRWGHTQDGSLLCGGDEPGCWWTEGCKTKRSCRRWNPVTGAWDLEIEPLTELRYGHVSWTPADGTATYLMGGDLSEKTSDVIENGRVKASFPLQYVTR